jgi:hypothetical protein
MNRHARIGTILFECNSYKESVIHPEVKDSPMPCISEQEYEKSTKYEMEKKKPFHPFSQLHLFVYQCIFYNRKQNKENTNTTKN